MHLEIYTLYMGLVDNPVLYLYIAVVLVDVVTGNVRAFIQKVWTSKVGLNGTLRHFAILAFVIVLLPAITHYSGTNIISNGLAMYIIAQYLLSIVENMSYFGFDLSDKITRHFPQMKGKDDHVDEEEK